MEIDYPQARKMTDGEQFAEVFRQLVQDKVKSAVCSKLGVTTIHFKDGSSCGGMWIWRQAGLEV